jgi:hypothetical protein
MKQWLGIVAAAFSVAALGQVDSTLLSPQPVKDTATDGKLNMDAVYARPFLTPSKVPVSLGGYLEAKAERLGTDGVSDGLSFAMQRMTLFVAASLHDRISFLSEVELEDGGRQVALEFAALDVALHPLLVLRGGMVLNPIGAFNQNHDGPKWEFNDRPIAAVGMLPATWSNVGFGLYGKSSKGPWTYGYECYLTNGFDESIVNNNEGRTLLSATKANPERFEESPNGVPMISGKVALRHEHVGELGLSTMNGVYNRFQEDGLVLDRRRRVDVVALDFNTKLGPMNTTLVGEWAWVLVDVPSTYTQAYGQRQQGGYLDVVQPVLQRPIFGFREAVLNLACRFEQVDLNVGRFRETGGSIGDDVLAVVPALSFRPVPGTVLRMNYRHQRQHDLLGNPPSITGGFQFGLASYF